MSEKISGSMTVSSECLGLKVYIAELERRSEDVASILDMVLTHMENDPDVGESSTVYGVLHGALDILLNANDFRPDELDMELN